MNLLARIICLFLLICSGVAQAQVSSPDTRPHRVDQINKFLNSTATTQSNPTSFNRQYTNGRTNFVASNAYFFNADPILFPKFSTCIARVKNNQGNCRVFLKGDSTTLGVGSNNSGSGNLSANGPAAVLAAVFNGAGINATYNAWWGTNSLGGSQTYSNSDGRITIGTGWSGTIEAYVGIAGNFIQGTTPGQLLTFAPTTKIDTCRVWYSPTSTTNTIQLDISSTNTVTQVVSGGGTGMSSLTTTGALGYNTCNVQVASGSSKIYVQGIEGWDSTKSAIIFENGGWSGATSFNAIGADSHLWGFSNGGLTNIAFDLILFGFGINEWDDFGSGNALYALPFYNQYMQNLINAAKLTSDIAIETSVPTNPASFNAPQALQQSFVGQDYALAVANNMPLVDTFNFLQSYAVGQPLGLYVDTFTHPSQLGYTKIWSLIGSFLLKAAGSGEGQNPIIFGTNQNGTNLDLTSGVASGTGTSGITFNIYKTGSSGTAQNVPTTAMTIPGTGIPTITGNSMIISQSNTPADNAVCSPGTVWWDTGFVYVCTASGTVKRATLNTY